MKRRPLLLVAALAFPFVVAACASEAPPSPEDEGNADTGVDATDTAASDSMTDGDARIPSDGDAISDGDTSVDDGPERKSCGSLPSSPPDQLCQVSKGASEWLLLRGDVLTGDTVYDNGSVLIDRSGENATIACSGCDCSGKTGGKTPTTVTCPKGVLSPGLINPHDHLGWATAGPYDSGETRYNHRNEWRRGKRGKPQIDRPKSRFKPKPVLHGELRHLFGGATSIAGSTRDKTPRGLLRNLDTPKATGGIDVNVEYSTFPLNDEEGTLRADGCDYNGKSSNDMDPYSVLNNDIYLPHVAEGIDDAAQNEFECLKKNGSESRDLIEDNTSIVHGIGVTAGDIQELAANGGQLVWSPRTNISLYGQTADIRTYRRYGVPVALGTDWPISGSMNMLRELSCADRLSEKYFDNAFADHDLWEMATYNGARALGVSDRLGRLADGYVADIALFNGRDQSDYSAVVEADASDVHLVLRGGEPLLGDEAIVGAITGDTSGCTQVNVCGNRRNVCVERDTADREKTITYESLKNVATSDSYPLFSCDTSMTFEPTCVPSRPDQYDGSISENDSDGDGVSDDADSCPSVFNPKRPLGDGQPNADGDELGDTCDGCPTAAGSMCALNDVDGDGVEDGEDNCPFTSNRAQADGDNDGVGDACDDTTTIYDIRNGAHQVGERVSLEEVVVTGVQAESGSEGVWVQVPEDVNRYDGPENSGIFVFLGSPPVPERGDRIDVRGRVTDFHGRQQISGVADLSVVDSGTALPAPVDVSPCQVRTNGMRTDALQAVLVRVEDVEVTNANPDGPDNDYGEFAVGSCSSGTGLRVDDLLYEITPDPTEGQSFTSIVGPLHYSFSNAKMVPRDAADVGLGPATLKGLEPPKSYMRANSSGVPTPGLDVVLDRSSSQPTKVDLNYPNTPKLTGPGSVTVPAGAKRASVNLQGKNASSSKTDFAAVDASIDGGPISTANVLVYDDSFSRAVDSLSTPASTVQTGDSFQVTVRLDIPASSGGETVTLTSGSDLELPASSPTVAADTFETSFTVGAGQNEAMKTLTASIGSSSVSLTVTVQSGPVGDCLIISEYIEGSGRYNKALELYNCGGSSLDLSTYGLCLTSNNNPPCGSESAMKATTLNPGEVYNVCNKKSANNGPVAGITNNCQEEMPNVVNFNGNDRVLIFEDQNGNGSYDAPNDAYVDSFGKPSVQPSGTPWADVTLRRCNLNPYLGQSMFDYTNYYTSHPTDDASHYGTPPSATSCP